MNRFICIAAITERELLRYSPAGLPIVSARLSHSSRQIEAEIERQIDFDIAAVAAGEISGRFNQANLGVEYQFTGFLTRKSRNSKSLVFHIVDFKTLSPEL